MGLVEFIRNRDINFRTMRLTGVEISREITGELLIEEILDGQTEFEGIKIVRSLGLTASPRFPELNEYIKSLDYVNFSSLDSNWISKEAELKQYMKERYEMEESTGQERDALVDQCRIEIRNSDLKDINLAGAYLAGISFRNVDLRRANFEGAYLKLARFHNVDLRRANFKEANLVKAEFWKPSSGYSVEMWHDYTDLRKADFRGANCFGTTFAHADLRKADFTGAEMDGVELWETNCRKAKFTGTDISGNMMYADFKGADFKDATIKGEIHYTNFKGAKLSEAETIIVHGLDLSDFGTTEPYSETLKQIEKASGKKLETKIIPSK